MIKAIPTKYKGVQYRSRLEAKWAAFFDNIGWRYTYEPMDLDGYIPDFLIHGERPFLVEVKPAVTQSDYRKPTEKILKALTGSDSALPVTVVGVSPIFGPYSGLSVHPDIEEPNNWSIWSECTGCGRIIIRPPERYGGPCGCDGVYYGQERTSCLLAPILDMHWRQAGNTVQWNAKGVDAPQFQYEGMHDRCTRCPHTAEVHDVAKNGGCMLCACRDFDWDGVER